MNRDANVPNKIFEMESKSICKEINTMTAVI